MSKDKLFLANYQEKTKKNRYKKNGVKRVENTLFTYFKLNIIKP